MRLVLFVLASALAYVLVLLSSESKAIMTYGLAGLVVGYALGWMCSYYLSRWWVTQQPWTPANTASAAKAPNGTARRSRNSALETRVTDELEEMGTRKTIAAKAARQAVAKSNTWDEALMIAQDLVRKTR